MGARIAAALFAALASGAALAQEDVSHCAELLPRLEEKLRTAPEPAALLWLAICRGHAGELEKASDAAVRFLVLYPNHPAAARARELLARIEAEERRRRRARQAEPARKPAPAEPPAQARTETPPATSLPAMPAPLSTQAIEAAPSTAPAAATQPPPQSPPAPGAPAAGPGSPAPPPLASRETTSVPPAAQPHGRSAQEVTPAPGRSDWKRPAGIATLAAGVLAGGFAAWQGIRSRSAINDANGRAQANGGAYLQSDLSSVSSARSEARTANILFVASGLLVASGLVLTFAF
jgi:hypothetical protein